MHRNIPEKKFSLLCPMFSDMRMFIFRLALALDSRIYLNCKGQRVDADACICVILL